jgi:putative protein kinase ArgK-like GTPase of G3E family
MIALGTETMVAMGKTRGHALAGGVKVDVIPEGPAQPTEERWTPPIVKCVATKGEGIAEVVDALDRHRALALGSEIERAVADVESKTIDPYTATEQLLTAFRNR